MKRLTFLPFIVLSGLAMAESTPETVNTISVSETNTVSQIDNVIPQLSLQAQQERAAQQAAEAQTQLALEEEKRARAEKLANAQQRIQQEIGTNQLQLAMSTAAVYADNHFMTMWQDKTAEKTFLKEYAAFAASGVSSKAGKALQQILNAPNEFAKDILLTDSFLDYLYYNKNVAANANQWLYNLGSYRAKSPSDNEINHWIEAVKQESAGQFVLNLVPRNHIYQETVQRLFADEPMSSPKKSSKTKKGKQSGEESTSQAVKNSSIFAKLALNTQRLRIIPSFSNGIFVNIPSYQLYYFRDGKLALQSKVIVGRDERRTPVMYSKLSNVVVNPPWNVPASIKNKDLVPKMRKDPSYVDRKGYEIIDSKGNKVNPHSINWAAYDSPEKNFPYHIRQKAGDDSALGRYKFNMPSSDAIYLHDTPSRGLFNKNDRALSSGCVRVAKADELATLLLKEAGWSEQKKQGILASKKTTSAPIRSDNPVYLYYVTAWVENGKIHKLPDIYKFDSNIPNITLDWAKIKTMI